MSRARKFTDADQLAAAMAQAAARVGPATARAVGHEAMVLQALIQAAASGRPGPNAITGRYRASWQVQVRPAATAPPPRSAPSRPRAAAWNWASTEPTPWAGCTRSRPFRTSPRHSP
ncbi:hypothetical protein O1L60_45230 [Streptomyces diastatochromogenes]|nr:hypothetical protein [Streptomyces diastatochromogenes]